MSKRKTIRRKAKTIGGNANKVVSRGRKPACGGQAKGPMPGM